MPNLRSLIHHLFLLLLAIPPALGATPMRFTAGPSQSNLYVVTHRAGALGFLGHEHAILATQWSATLCFDPQAPASSPVRAEITVSTEALRIDTDQARALAGLDKGPSEEDIRKLQQKVLAPENLAAGSHPRLQFKLSSVAPGEGRKLEAQGTITVRGVTENVRFPLQVEPQRTDLVRLFGQLRLKQTTFGIKPESVAGVVNVADAVDVHFDILATPTGEGCP